jgi:hypothetical protein
MIFHDVEQNSPEWDALRLGKPTASGYAKFMANYGCPFGDPAKRYALQIALEKVTGRKAEYSFKNDYMEMGQEQEPLAKMAYEEMTFSEVTNGGFFDCGEWGDSPDGLVNGVGVTEFKCVIASTHEATIKRGAPDPAYKWQLVGHLDATGREWVDFGSYCADYPEWNRLVIYRVHRADVEEELRQLAERREQFLAVVAEKINEINNGK